MPFSYNLGTLIRKSDGLLSEINSEKELKLYNYDNDTNLESSLLITKENLSFLDYYFDIKENDSLYGIITLKRKDLYYIYINKKAILKKRISSITNENECIKFPYIILLNKEFNIFYYIVDNSNSTCKLIHLSLNDKKWTKHVVDVFKFNILTNFVIIKNENSFNIFYFKLINNIEQICMRNFDTSKSSWSESSIITTSDNAKVYLSILKDNLSKYHITYSENINNRYYCMYIKGYTIEDKFICSKNSIICKGVACIFPNIIKYNNVLSIQWVEFNTLHSCISNDLGESWMYSSQDKYSISNPFTLYYYRSNYIADKKNNFPNIFAGKKDIKFLGIRYVYK